MLAIMAAMPDNFRPVRHRKDKEATPSLGTLMNYIRVWLFSSRRDQAPWKASG